MNLISKEEVIGAICDKQIPAEIRELLYAKINDIPVVISGFSKCGNCLHFEKAPYNMCTYWGNHTFSDSFCNMCMTNEWRENYGR